MAKLGTNDVEYDYDYGSTAATPALPAIDPNGEFRYGHHPDHWTIDVAAGRLLPAMSIIVAMGGVNGTLGTDVTVRDAALARDGWTLLPPNTMPEGSDRPYYTRALRVRQGIAHRPVWESYAPRGVKPIMDHEGFAEWRAWLVDSGVIQPPTDIVLDRLRDRVENKLHDASMTASVSPVSARMVERCKAQLAILDAALNPVEEEPEPKKPAARKTSGSASK